MSIDIRKPKNLSKFYKRDEIVIKSCASIEILVNKVLKSEKVPYK